MQFYLECQPIIEGSSFYNVHEGDVMNPVKNFGHSN